MYAQTCIHYIYANNQCVRTHTHIYNIERDDTTRAHTHIHTQIEKDDTTHTHSVSSAGGMSVSPHALTRASACVCEREIKNEVRDGREEEEREIINQRL